MFININHIHVKYNIVIKQTFSFMWNMLNLTFEYFILCKIYTVYVLWDKL